MTKIAVIGDIHSNLVNLKTAIGCIQKNQLSHIIVVGDLQNLETIDIIGSTNIKTSIVFGNADFDTDSFINRAKKYSNLSICGKIGELIVSDGNILEEKCNSHKISSEVDTPSPPRWGELHGSPKMEKEHKKVVKIAFCHYPQTARKLAKENNFDVIFTGHWHSPWEERIENTLIIRPGEIAGQFYRPTFCIFDTEKMKAELVMVN